MRKGQAVKYKITEGREVLAVIRTAHKDGSCTVEARFTLEEGKPSGNYLGYRYRMPRHRLLAA